MIFSSDLYTGDDTVCVFCDQHEEDLLALYWTILYVM